MDRRPFALALDWTLGITCACLTGSIPALAQPHLWPPEPAPEGMTLRWTDAGPSRAYTVQVRDRLQGGLWLLPGPNTAWPISERQWIDFAAPPPARFYRVLAVPAAERGRLLTSRFDRTMTRLEITLLLQAIGVSLPPLHDVRLYKFTYETIGPWGERTHASAALVVPVTPGRAWPLFSYQHGTIVRTNDAPSAMNPYGELAVGLVFASRGFVSVLPDYLGLGDSPGLHPYHHARSEATACVDALRAARTLCAQQAVSLNDQLFLAGYSQGGHATLALHREIEFFHTNEFNLIASAPMAGAYDLSGVTTEDVLSSRPQPNPYYFAYLLAAYQSVYELTNRLADLLVPPYDSVLPPRFNGQFSGSEINAVMPSNPLLILKPEVLAAFRNDPDHPLRLALRDNDLHRWRPTRALRLYHCSGDADVVFANSEVALQSFHQQGATHVQLFNPVPGGSHGDCVYPSLLSALQWFESLRR